jgi:hypothetical protein
MKIENNGENRRFNYKINRLLTGESRSGTLRVLPREDQFPAISSAPEKNRPSSERAGR